MKRTACSLATAIVLDLGAGNAMCKERHPFQKEFMIISYNQLEKKNTC